MKYKDLHTQKKKKKSRGLKKDPWVIWKYLNQRVGYCYEERVLLKFKGVLSTFRDWKINLRVITFLSPTDHVLSWYSSEFYHIDPLTPPGAPKGISPSSEIPKIQSPFFRKIITAWIFTLFRWFWCRNICMEIYIG